MFALVPGEGQPAAFAPAAKPGSEAWRDYEYALKIGTKEVWELFLASHPTGFHAGLAKTELDRLLSAAAAPTSVTAPQSAPPAAAATPSLAAVEPTVPVEAVKPPAPEEAKPPAPAATKPAATAPNPPTAPTRKFHPASKPEPESPPKKATTRKSDDEDDRPNARARQQRREASRESDRESTRGARERPARTSSEDRPRRTGGSACAYGRTGVRWARAYGLDNGHGVVSAVASACGD
jgi:hypothetical protein